MNADEALKFTNFLLKKQGYKKLRNIESEIFRKVWEDRKSKNYREIAEVLKYAEGSIKTTAYELWKKLSKPLGEKVSRTNLREVIKAKIRDYSEVIEFKEPVLNVNFLSQTTFTIYEHENELEELKSSQRRVKYRQAWEFIKAAGLLEQRDDFKFILDALNIYKQLGDIDQAADLLVKPINTSWEQQENIGRIAYRLGVLTPMIRAIDWIIDKIEAGYYLPATVTTMLYNKAGDFIWMSSNNTSQAIPLHEKSQEWAYKSQSGNIIVASESNKALCNIDRGEIEEARKSISKAYELIKLVGDTYDYRRHEITCDCLNAYIETLENKHEGTELAKKAYSILSNEKELEKLNMWEKANLPIYVAKSLQNIGNYGAAFEMYNQADLLAKASGYIQVEAQALSGIALLKYLDDKEYIEQAISSLFKAEKMFEFIKAEGDNAQVNLLLGVMFKELGKTQESQKYFEQVEKFYTARNASQKIIEVNKIREVHGIA